MGEQHYGREKNSGTPWSVETSRWYALGSHCLSLPLGRDVLRGPQQDVTGQCALSAKNKCATQDSTRKHNWAQHTQTLLPSFFPSFLQGRTSCVPSLACSSSPGELVALYFTRRSTILSLLWSRGATGAELSTCGGLFWLGSIMWVVLWVPI